MNKTYRTIKVERDQKTLWIILNIPQQLNALNGVFFGEFSQVLAEAEKDDNIRCLVITGEGDKAFSSGANIAMLSKMTSAKIEEFSKTGQKTFSKLEEISKPSIAAINGLALGGGLELALACDIRIAAEHAELGSPEVTLGLIPAWGGTQRLARVVGLAKAKEMILLGVKVKANEALRIGLVHKVVRGSMLREDVKELAAKFCEKPPLALKFAKRALNFGTQLSLEEGLQLESSLMGLISSTEDFKEGIDAFLSKRKAEFKGK